MNRHKLIFWIGVILFAVFILAMSPLSLFAGDMRSGEAYATDGQSPCTAVATPTSSRAREGVAVFLAKCVAGIGVTPAGGVRVSAAGHILSPEDRRA